MVVRLEEVATRCIELESTAPNRTNGTVALGSTFAGVVAGEGFLRLPRTARVRLFTLENVVFDTTVCTLHHQGELIVDSAYLTDSHEQPERNWRADRLVPAPGGVAPIIGFNRAWEHNHYHWIVQALPAIDSAIAASEATQPLVLLPPVGPRHIEGLRLLGHPHARYVSIAPHQRALMAGCIYNEMLNGSTAFELSMVARRTFDKLAAAAGAEVPDVPLIYVARIDAEHRRMQNEHDVIELLERLGFRTVVPGKLSLTEQIVMFRNAKMVIGPHGAGMANIAFCQPGTLVYEVLPRHYANPCMNRLAQAGSLLYAADLFENLPTEKPAWLAPWAVDLGQLERTVSNLLARVR